jgi:FkbM family methyltransferase
MPSTAPSTRSLIHEVGRIGRLRVLLGRVFGVKVTRVDGLRFSTTASVVPWIIRKALYNRSYEAPERMLIRAILEPGDRVVEIGACSGMVSVVCASIVGAENVLSYEANPALEALIRQNFALNGLKPNVRMKAVTADGRDVVLHVPKWVFSSSLVDGIKGEAVTVASDAFAAIMAEFRPTALVLDVEGSEDELLGSGDLEGVHKIVVEMHPHIIGEARVAAIEDRLVSLGFSISNRALNAVSLVR